MQRAPPSRVKRPRSYARPADSSSKLRAQGSFYKAKNFTINDPTFYDTSHHLEKFMEKLARKTIPGAAFDSSERDPPPRCHPGTRLAMVERTLRFFANQECNKRLLWVVGPAGVGKSAIMQTLAETPSTPDFTLGASVFFSVNGRDNGSKIIATLAYQLAVKSKPYKDFVQSELANDPTLLDKALIPQFNKFIIEPFVAQGMSPQGHKCFLILIDGLDECNDHDMQCAILDLISSFCTKYPTAPLVWVIASRPEPHITRFLSRPNVAPSYTKEEIEVDSDQSREDVERYLRDELENVRMKYPALDHFSHWPAEHDFLKLAAATGGLFAFGKTVVDYIDDPIYANPASQLEEVLEVIDEVRSREGEGKRHPMAGLDALYSRIISKIPKGTLNDTKRLLLQMLCPPSDTSSQCHLSFYCNWLGMTTAAAYGALHHLHSVLDIPSVPNAEFGKLRFRHKSFRDYLTNFKRSGVFPNSKDEARELNIQCVTMILDGASKAREIGLSPYNGISLSWPPQTEFHKNNKHSHYRRAHRFILNYLRTCGREDTRCDPGIVSALKLTDATFKGFGNSNTRIAFVIFGENLRPKLKELNAFQEQSIGKLDVDKIGHQMDSNVNYHFRHQNMVPPLQCRQGGCHAERVNGRSPGHPDGDYFWRFEYRDGYRCDCKDLAMRKLEDRRTHSPDDIMTTLAGTGEYGWIYHKFPDSEHPSSTWEYIVPYQFNPVVEK